MSEWSADVESSCASLGTWDGQKYVPDPDCLECVKDLIRFLRRDNENHEIRRQLGQIQVLQSDLLPLLKLKDSDSGQDPELFDMVLRVLVNLTNPELLLFREELPEEKVTRNYYMQLQGHRQQYKGVWEVLRGKLVDLLGKEDRSEEEDLTIERLLILVRNVLQVPRDANSESLTDDDVSVHDKILWVLHKSGMEDLLLFMSTDSGQFCLHVLEIVSLIFKEQDPSSLALASITRSEAEKNADEEALAKLSRLEQLQKQKQRPLSGGRHSRFGGTFVVNNVASISDNHGVITNRPVSRLTGLNFDKSKRPKKVSRNRVTPADEICTSRRSTLAVRLFLKEFCLEFLSGSYNQLMATVKDQLIRQRAQQNDESYYMWSIRFFLEFNRAHGFRAELVSESISKSVFHYIQLQIEQCKDNFEHEKKNRRICLIWARRIHLSLRAYQELLMTLVAMENSSNEAIKQSAKVIKAGVFFEPEYRELCLSLFNLYTAEKFSLGFITDLVETNHVFLKLMEHMAKAKHLTVAKKVTRRKKGKMKSKKNNRYKIARRFLQNPSNADMSVRESKEEIWDIVSPNISELLQGEVSALATPFDAASEVPIEDQKAVALYRVQTHLKKCQARPALALLRASRDVWPEGDVFGPSDADPEDEFMALREILFTEMDKPKEMTVTMDEEEETPNQEEGGEVGEEDVDEEDAEGEEEQVETYTTEQEFDYHGFVIRFGSRNVCSAYSTLFKRYRTNKDHTNHCIVKMFHRLAFDCKMPALFYQVAILRTCQQINNDFKLAPNSKSLRELRTFAKFLVGQFFSTVETNKKVFFELLFWKSPREASDLQEGYANENTSLSSRQKASFWSEEDEEKLSRVFQQFMEMRARGEESGGNVLDAIEAFFEGKKTKRQITRKLKTMELIKDTKELKGPPKTRRKGKKNGTGSREEDERNDEQGEERYLSKSFVDSDSSSDEEAPRQNKPNDEQAATSNEQGDRKFLSRTFVDSDSSSDEEAPRQNKPNDEQAATSNEPGEKRFLSRTFVDSDSSSDEETSTKPRSDEKEYVEKAKEQHESNSSHGESDHDSRFDKETTQNPPDKTSEGDLSADEVQPSTQKDASSPLSSLYNGKRLPSTSPLSTPDTKRMRRTSGKENDDVRDSDHEDSPVKRTRRTNAILSDDDDE